MAVEGKRCSKCREVRPLSGFYACAKLPDGKQKQCKACVKETNGRWYAAHRATHLQTTAAWYASNTARKAATVAAQRAANPGARLEERLRNKARRAGGTFSRRDAKEVRAVACGQCAYCLRTDRPLQTEHVVSLVSGGDHGAWNVVMACAPCNLRKGRSGPLAMLTLEGVKTWL